MFFEHSFQCCFFFFDLADQSCPVQFYGLQPISSQETWSCPTNDVQRQTLLFLLVIPYLNLCFPFDRYVMTSVRCKLAARFLEIYFLSFSFWYQCDWTPCVHDEGRCSSIDVHVHLDSFFLLCSGMIHIHVLPFIMLLLIFFFFHIQSSLRISACCLQMT